MNEDLEEARVVLRERLTTILGSKLDEAELKRLDEALTHPSFANETPTRDNQRLEFLGDAVLGLCVSELLIAAHPLADEGLLTRMRASLVNAEALARWARASGVGATIAFGRGARAGSEREQTNVLADAVEAIVAAVYETRALEGARLLVRDVVGSSLEDAKGLAMPDPKSALQELVQGRKLPTPIYRLVETRGPQRDAIFVIEVSVGERVLARGEGRSKRAAEREAAAAALVVIDEQGLA